MADRRHEFRKAQQDREAMRVVPVRRELRADGVRLTGASLLRGAVEMPFAALPMRDSNWACISA